MFYNQTNLIFNGIDLQLDYAFGCYQTPIRKNSYFYSNDQIIYIAGNHIVIYDATHNKQKYIMKNIEDEAVTAMNYYYSSKSDELMVAVALKPNIKKSMLAQVKIYNHNKPQNNCSMIHNHQTMDSVINDLTFLLKGKILVTLTQKANNQKTLMSLNAFRVGRQDKLICYSDLQENEKVVGIEIPDKHSSNFVLFGRKYLKIWIFNQNDNMLEIGLDLKDKLKIENDIIDVKLTSDPPFIYVATNTNQIIKIKANYLADQISYTIDQIININTTLEEQQSSKHKQQQESNNPDDMIGITLSSSMPYVSCLGKLNRGIVVGFQGGFKGNGVLGLYELDSRNDLQWKGNFKLADSHISGYHSIDISLDDTACIITVIKGSQGNQYSTGQNQISDDKNQRVELYKFDLLSVMAIENIKNEPYEALFENGVHKGGVINISISVGRSLMASIGNEKSLKIWEYGQDYKELIQQKFIADSPLCLDLHPFGYQIALGFKDGIKIFFILDKELKPSFTGQQKQCTALKYSNGGHLLAASLSVNPCMIYIYNTYSFELQLQFPGHGNSIRELQWTSLPNNVRDQNSTTRNQDTHLISSCTGGQIIVWDYYWQQSQTEDQDKESDFDEKEKVLQYNFNGYFNNQNAKIIAVAYDPDYKQILASFDNNHLVILNDKTCKEGESEYGCYDTSPQQYTSILLSKDMKVVFFGTNQGSIKIQFWPFESKGKKQAKSLETMDIPIHQSSITQMRITIDNYYLITCSEDSVVYFSKIRQYQDGADITIEPLNFIKDNQDFDKINTTYPMNMLCLCSRQQIETNKEEIKELQYKLQNFKTDLDDEKERQEDDHLQKLNTLDEKHRDQQNKEREKLYIVFNQYEQKYNDKKEQLQKIRDEFNKKQEDMSKNNSGGLIECYETFTRLTEEKKRLKEKFDQQYEEQKEKCKQSVKENEEEWNLKFQKLFSQYDDALTNVTSDEDKFRAVLGQMEEDFKFYEDKMNNQLNEELSKERKKTENLRSTKSQKQKEIERYKQRKNFLQQLKDDVESENKNLEQDQLKFKEKRNLMSQQLSEKEEVINTKEQQIKDFRSKNIHLQNFQKVYDYRVNTLKDERQPLTDHLSNMDKHVKNLYKELLEEAGMNKQYDQELAAGDEKKQIMKSQLTQKNEFVAYTRRQIEIFEYRVTMMLKQEQFQSWPTQMDDIYDTSFTKQQNKLEKIVEQSIIGSNLKQLKKDPALILLENESNQLIRDHLQNQKDYQQKKLITVGQDYKLEMEDRNNAYLRVQNMNTLLINECNKLRDQKQKLKDFLSIQKKAKKEVQRELKNFSEIEQTMDILEDDMYPASDQKDAAHASKKKKIDLSEKLLPFQKYQKTKQQSVELASLSKQSSLINIQPQTEKNKSRDLIIRDLLNQIKQNKESDPQSNTKSQVSQYLTKKPVIDKVFPILPKDQFLSNKTTLTPIVIPGQSKTTKNINQQSAIDLGIKGRQKPFEVSSPPQSRSTRQSSNLMAATRTSNFGFGHSQSHFNKSQIEFNRTSKTPFGNFQKK